MGVASVLQLAGEAAQLQKELQSCSSLSDASDSWPVICCSSAFVCSALTVSRSAPFLLAGARFLTQPTVCSPVSVCFPLLTSRLCTLVGSLWWGFKD